MVLYCVASALPFANDGFKMTHSRLYANKKSLMSHTYGTSDLLSTCCHPNSETISIRFPLFRYAVFTGYILLPITQEMRHQVLGHLPVRLASHKPIHQTAYTSGFHHPRFSVLPLCRLLTFAHGILTVFSIRKTALSVKRFPKFLFFRNIFPGFSFFMQSFYFLHLNFCILLK